MNGQKKSGSGEKHITVACPNCGCKGKYTVYTSINTGENAGLRDRILDQSLFVYVCPQCGESVWAPYPCLYHNPERKYLVYYTDNENEPIEPPDIFRKNKYVMRRVADADALAEKIKIFDRQLDDRIVEVMKWMLLPELKSGYPKQDIRLLYVDFSDDNSFIFLAPTSDSLMKVAAVSEDHYEKLNKFSNDISALKDSKRFLRVDSSWIESPEAQNLISKLSEKMKWTK